MAVLEAFSHDLLEETLKGIYKEEEFSIIEFSTKDAAATGDNYTSSVLRVKVCYQRKNSDKVEHISVIVKVQPSGNTMEILTNSMNLFPKEIEVFAKILPKIYDILSPELRGSLSSTCFLATERKSRILVLEDLQPYGFVMVPRRKGLDLDHCKIAMKKIAVFHAASAVLAEKDLSLMKNFETGLFSHNPYLMPYFHIGVEFLIKFCLQNPTLVNLGKKFQKLGVENLISKGIEAAGTSEKFNVLNHGDFWINNFLFSYHPDGKLKDFRFIDFQMVKYATPTLDLHYFLSTSPTQSVRIEHTESLLELYYESLIANLEELEHSLDIPTREDFFKEFYSRCFYGVLTLATVAALVKAPYRDDATFEDYMKSDDEDSFRYDCHTNSEYIEFLEIVLKQYEKYLNFE